MDQFQEQLLASLAEAEAAAEVVDETQPGSIPPPLAEPDLEGVDPAVEEEPNTTAATLPKPKAKSKAKAKAKASTKPAVDPEEAARRAEHRALFRKLDGMLKYYAPGLRIRLQLMLHPPTCMEELVENYRQRL
eukprot:304188-Amphidinium_carterae.1